MNRPRSPSRRCRHQPSGPDGPRGREGGLARPGDLAIDYERRRVTAAGRVVTLTASEYELVRLLSVNAGRVTDSRAGPRSRP